MNISKMLPNELLYNVFVELNGKSVIYAGRVCKAWHEISKDQRLWRSLFLKACSAENPSNNESKNKILDWKRRVLWLQCLPDLYSKPPVTYEYNLPDGLTLSSDNPQLSDGRLTLRETNNSQLSDGRLALHKTKLDYFYLMGGEGQSVTYGYLDKDRNEMVERQEEGQVPIPLKWKNDDISEENVHAGGRSRAVRRAYRVGYDLFCFIQEVPNGSFRRPPHDHFEITKHAHKVTAICPLGALEKRIYVTGDESGEFRLWDLVDGGEIEMFDGGEIAMCKVGEKIQNILCSDDRIIIVCSRSPSTLINNGVYEQFTTPEGTMYATVHIMDVDIPTRAISQIKVFNVIQKPTRITIVDRLLAITTSEEGSSRLEEEYSNVLTSIQLVDLNNGAEVANFRLPFRSRNIQFLNPTTILHAYSASACKENTLAVTTFIPNNEPLLNQLSRLSRQKKKWGCNCS